MGFDDQEIVALSGAHAVGRCHTNRYDTIAARVLYIRTHNALVRSGYEGPWTFSPVTFSNEYFKLLFNETYVLPTLQPRYNIHRCL